MKSLPQDYSAIVFGSTGGIGTAFCALLEADPRCGQVTGLSRASTPALELKDEDSIAHAAETLQGEHALIIDATGFLSDESIRPEKSLRHLNATSMARLYELNAIGPALLMKHFHRRLPREGRGIFATLSARVGSIGDNQLGGWYSYRAAKAALNMLVKSTAIEVARTRPEAVLAALHPGTVATSLSDPFSSTRERLQPGESAAAMLEVLDRLTPQDTGTFWDYRGTPVDW